MKKILKLHKESRSFIFDRVRNVTGEDGGKFFSFLHLFFF